MTWIKPDGSVLLSLLPSGRPKSRYNRGVAREKNRSLQQALSDLDAYAQLVPSDPDGPSSVARVKAELSAR